jgi:mono/diheme cytochrome c family protein
MVLQKAAAAWFCSLAAVAASAQGDPTAFFHEKVEPILVGRCLTCHGGDEKGGLDLRSAESALAGGKSGVALMPGDAGASLLFEKVAAGEMPPKTPLSEDEIAVVKKWIADGAFFPDTPLDPFAATTEKRAGYDWWSLQPLNDAAPPDVVATLPDDIPAKERAAALAWNEHPIDRFIFAKLAAQNLQPSPPADPRTLIRRATYDLIGLPPAPEEIDAFITECEAETGSREVVGEAAYNRLIDRLLASPHYGERWGRHWLDVVRFGESTGYEVNHIIDNLWPFRDYVIDSFNDDKPFDRLVREHIAADSVDPGNPEVEIGMAFLVAGPYDIVGNQDPVAAAQIRANTIDEIIRATTESFIGLTTGCARCHDHKFDPISQRDYYRMYATFAGVRHGTREVATAEQRQARVEALGPLPAERDRLNGEITAIENAILERAAAKIDEYYARWPRPAVSRAGTEERFEAVEAKYLRLVAEGSDHNPYDRTNFKIDEFEVWTAGETPRNAAAAANGGMAVGSSRVAEDFGEAYKADVVIDGKFGVSWIAQSPELVIEFAQVETIDSVLFSSDRLDQIGEGNSEARFVCEYRIEVSLDGESWTEVANSYDREPATDAHKRKRYLDHETTEEEAAQLAALKDELGQVNGELAKVPGLPVLWAGTLEQPKEPFHIFMGGDPQRKGDEVVPASMQALSDGELGYALATDTAESERRRLLAEWIVDERNPLTPRVLVNRLWHYHFGTGIVATPSDFGFMGMAPSHPELLDWLAKELIEPTYDAGDEEAWRIKRVHRLIMTSRAYRQGSAYRDEAARVDSDSRLLWRFPPRRLTAEALRDTMLSVAGQLDTAVGGPPYRMYRYLRDNVSTYIPLDEHGPETYRRAVYHQNVRAARIDLLTDFDAPDCAMTAPRRAATTSPLQALTLMNHSFTLDMAAFLAERLRAEEGEDARAWINRAFELAFGRSADTGEVDAAADLIREHGPEAFCRALFNANEMMYVN